MSDALKISSESPSGAPSMTPAQGAILARCFQIGFGALQARIVRGDEDSRLAEMTDTFEAYFAVCRSKLGHDQVPIVTWETYVMIKRRGALTCEQQR